MVSWNMIVKIDHLSTCGDSETPAKTGPAPAGGLLDPQVWLPYEKRTYCNSSPILGGVFPSGGLNPLEPTLNANPLDLAMLCSRF